MNDEGAVLVRTPKLDGLSAGDLSGNLLLVARLLESPGSDDATRAAVTEPRRAVGPGLVDEDSTIGSRDVRHPN